MQQKSPNQQTLGTVCSSSQQAVCGVNARQAETCVRVTRAQKQQRWSERVEQTVQSDDLEDVVHLNFLPFNLRQTRLNSHHCQTQRPHTRVLPATPPNTATTHMSTASNTTKHSGHTHEYCVSRYSTSAIHITASLLLCVRTAQ